MIKILTLSRQIHRIAMWAVVVFGLVMGVTGTMLKFSLGTIAIRQIHNNLSIFLVVALAFMIVTGLVMYFSSTLVRFSQKR